MEKQKAKKREALQVNLYSYGGGEKGHFLN